MASSTITLSDLAPADQTIHFSFASEDFDLGGSAKKSFETPDADTLGNASEHPWLVVNSSAQAVEPRFVDNQIPPTEDAFSRFGPNANLANDPDAVAAIEDSKLTGEDQRVAFDAGKNQNVEVVTGGVAETIAADEDATAAKSAAAFKSTDEAAREAAAPPAPEGPAFGITSPDTNKDA